MPREPAGIVPRAGAGGPAEPDPRVRPARHGLEQVGAGADAPPVPVNPNVVESPAASTPLYETFLTVTAEPLVLSVPFQSWLMAWPLASVHFTVQPLIADAPAFTVTSAWYPPGQELTVRYVAVQAPAAGGGDVGGVEVGGAVSSAGTS